MTEATTPSEPMTKEEFCRRFVDYMVGRAGEKFSDGESIREYAESVAEASWEDPDQRAEGPEESAGADMSYWGEG